MNYFTQREKKNRKKSAESEKTNKQFTIYTKKHLTLEKKKKVDPIPS